MLNFRFYETTSLIAEFLLSLLFVLCCSAALFANNNPPNVILIMTDDQGLGDFGCTGNPLIKTPNIDAMAARSRRMANFHVSPVCTPTRASLMTGRYNYRTRAIDTYLGRAMMDTGETTVAEVMRDRGYATGIFGKWHLGDCYPMRAIDQGFDYALVHRGGGIGQPSDPRAAEGKYTDPILMLNGKPKQFSGYCSDIYFNHAIEFISKSTADRKPFFAYIADNCPHGPFHDVPDNWLNTYRNIDLSDSRFPQVSVHRPNEQNADLDRRARIFAMISNVDENIGRLVTQLDRLGIREDTIIIFLTDNGPNGRRYVAGHRGSKSSVYEGGIKTLFLVDWPGRFASPASCDLIAAHIDVMPTILDACNIEIPGKLKLDGTSLLPMLDDVHHEPSTRTIFVQSHRGNQPQRYHHFAARDQKWKLVHHSGFHRQEFQGEPEFELFDLGADPFETRDVASENPDVVKRLAERYNRWFDDVSDTRSNNFSAPRIVVGTSAENPTTLTRQDWRMPDGPQKTNRHRWLLRSAHNGRYDIRCYFKDNSVGSRATLRIDDRVFNAPVDPHTREAHFKNVGVDPGNFDLSIDAPTADKPHAAYQVQMFCSNPTQPPNGDD